MNPCPCGYLGEQSGRCHCSVTQVARYRGRISGPLLDRIDLHVEVPRLPLDQFSQARDQGVEGSAEIRKRVEAARDRQLARAGKPNQTLSPPEIDRFCALDDRGRQLLTRALEKLGLSARAYHRVLKVARTIADLADKEGIETMHLSEAIGYRKLDRNTALL